MTASSIAPWILLLFYLSGRSTARLFSHISPSAFQLIGELIFFIYAMQMLRLTPSGIITSLYRRAPASFGRYHA